MEDRELGELLSDRMMGLFHTAAALVREDPGLLPFVIRTISSQKKAASRRKRLQKEGLHVPPFIIMSITNSCNLDCIGCYAKKFRRTSGSEMTTDLMDDILSQASNLGISVAMIAGGEPLLRKDLLEVLERHPEIIFPLFTNGTMLSGAVLKRIGENRHIIPVLSIDGFKDRTDQRRGEGVFSRLRWTSTDLGRSEIFWGASITVTRSNFDEVTHPMFIEQLHCRGCRLFFFVEYIPVAEGSESEVPTEVQRKSIVLLTDGLGKRFPGIFIAFPGHEEIFGGCISSGRGFVHINPQGDLEPCPFAPYSDTNLKDVTLKEALGSRLLLEIRDNHERLEEGSGGCALWENRAWVKGLLDG